MKIIAILTLGMALALVGCDQGGTDDEYNTGTGSGSSVSTNTSPNNNSSGAGNSATNSTENQQP